MTTRPTTYIRQFQGNARWSWHCGWVMPARINEGPGYKSMTLTDRLTVSKKTRAIDMATHRHLRHLMAPNCRGGCR